MAGATATRACSRCQYDVTGLSLPNAFHAVHRVPVDGEYVVRVVLGGQRPAGSEPISDLARGSTTAKC